MPRAPAALHDRAGAGTEAHVLVEPAQIGEGAVPDRRACPSRGRRHSACAVRTLGARRLPRVYSTTTWYTPGSRRLHRAPEGHRAARLRLQAEGGEARGCARVAGLPASGRRFEEADLGRTPAAAGRVARQTADQVAPCRGRLRSPRSRYAGSTGWARAVRGDPRDTSRRQRAVLRSPGGGVGSMSAGYSASAAERGSDTAVAWSDRTSRLRRGSLVRDRSSAHGRGTGGQHDYSDGRSGAGARAHDGRKLNH